MKRYILGYTDDTWENGIPRQFDTEAEADDIADEWVSIPAESIEEAITKYERAFFDWQVKNGLAKPGDMDE